MLHRSPARSCLFGTLLLSAALGCAGSPETSTWRDPPKVTPESDPPENTENAPVTLHGQLQVDGTTLKDQNGAPIQLKGVSSMWLNWESSPFAESRAGLRFMRDNWKLSVIRAAMGIEVDRGYLKGDEFKEAMVNAVEGVIKNAIKLGVYVLVDWHTEKAVSQQADAVAFFTEMAQKWGSYPNVIWEPYNEPRVSPTTDPPAAWAKVKAYHEAVVDAIRAVDPDNLIIMGTGNWSQDVDVASANPVAPTSGTRNLMYTLHFYACTHGQSFRDKANVALAAGLGIFITEFGATPADGGTSQDPYVCRDETNAWFDWMAQNNISGVAWKLDHCADTSCILGSKASTDGKWTDDMLSTDEKNTKQVSTTVASGTQGGGHGKFIVDWLRQ